MKILFDYAAFTMQSKGGVSRCMYELFRHLSSSDEHSTRLYAGIHRNRYLKHAPRALKRKIIGFYLPDSLCKQTIFMPFNRFCFQIYARFFQPDLCQFTYYDAPKTPANCKNVLTVYDMIHEKFPEYFRAENPQAGWKRKAVRAAHAVICISENTRLDLETHLDLSGKTVTAIPIGSELPEPREGAPPPIPTPYLLYVGNRNPAYKNFTTLLKAFALIKTFWHGKLLCFGGGSFDSRENTLMAELGVTDKTEQISGDDDALANAYRHASALVYPSTYEGFGLPPVEAMSLGCPVLSSSSPPMPEILGDACLFFPPDSPTDLAERFRELLDPIAREDLVHRGKTQSDRYEWGGVSERTLSFYTFVVKG